MTSESGETETQPPPPRVSEDWLAVICAAALLLVSLSVVLLFGDVSTEGQLVSITSPLKPWFGKPGNWTSSPLDSVLPTDDSGVRSVAGVTPLVGVFATLALLFTAGVSWRDGAGFSFLKGFAGVFLLATVVYILAAHNVVKAYNLEYALWALMLGLLISNTVGTPAFVKPAVRTEFFIKTGLVLLGAEVLMSRLLALGIPGFFVAWVVTPIVLISTYAFGQKVLKMESRSLNMVISADMSVCGVSAAIAAAAACWSSAGATTKLRLRTRRLLQNQ